MGAKLLRRSIWSLIGGVALTAEDYALRPHLRSPEVAELFVARIVIFFVIFTVMPYFTKRPLP
jgi:hypothetical protein